VGDGAEQHNAIGVVGSAKVIGHVAGRFSGAAATLLLLATGLFAPPTHRIPVCSVRV
jgi:hypothetical protein